MIAACKMSPCIHRSWHNLVCFFQISIRNNRKSCITPKRLRTLEDWCCLQIWNEPILLAAASTKWKLRINKVNDSSRRPHISLNKKGKRECFGLLSPHPLYLLLCLLSLLHPSLLSCLLTELSLVFYLLWKCLKISLIETKSLIEVVVLLSLSIIYSTGCN